MKSPGLLVSPSRRRITGTLALLGPLVLGVVRLWAAQAVAPVGGVTGTMVVEGTVEKEYGAANTVMVKTADGVRHLFHYTRDLLVHGGKGTGVDALNGLREGSTVVLHYTTQGSEASAQEIDRIGDDGLKVTEGVVTRVDRARKEIVVRFDSGLTETFQLTDRAASDAGKDVEGAGLGTARVSVYYTDEAGHKVAHFFKRTS